MPAELSFKGKIPVVGQYVCLYFPLRILLASALAGLSHMCWEMQMLGRCQMEKLRLIIQTACLLYIIVKSVLFSKWIAFFFSFLNLHIINYLEKIQRAMFLSDGILQEI